MTDTDRLLLKEFLDQRLQIQGLAGNDLEHLSDTSNFLHETTRCNHHIVLLQDYEQRASPSRRRSFVYGVCKPPAKVGGRVSHQEFPPSE